jgi:hypothetical protein
MREVGEKQGMTQAKEKFRNEGGRGEAGMTQAKEKFRNEGGRGEAGNDVSQGENPERGRSGRSRESRNKGNQGEILRTEHIESWNCNHPGRENEIFFFPFPDVCV